MSKENLYKNLDCSDYQAQVLNNSSFVQFKNISVSGIHLDNIANLYIHFPYKSICKLSNMPKL